MVLDSWWLITQILQVPDPLGHSVAGKTLGSSRQIPCFGGEEYVRVVVPNPKPTGMIEDISQVSSECCVEFFEPSVQKVSTILSNL